MPSSIKIRPAHRNSINSSQGRLRRRDGLAGTAIAASLLAALAFVCLMTGPYPLSLHFVISELAERARGVHPTSPGPADAVLFSIRGPRVLGAILVGAALSSAGACYQGLFRNPLVSPDILGVSSGSALGAAAGILLRWSVSGVEAAAFLGGLATVAAVYSIAATLRNRDPVLTLVLGGVVLGALAGSGVGLIKFLADPENQLPALTFWLLGSLASFNGSDLASLAGPVVVSLVPLFLLRWQLDVMTLGDDEARALGVHASMIRCVATGSATLMTAASVAVGGVIGWVGLVMPHVARLIVGPSFVRLLPMAAILGTGFLLAVDTVARTLGSVELPIGILTAVVGTPIFLFLLARSSRGWQ